MRRDRFVTSVWLTCAPALSSYWRTLMFYSSTDVKTNTRFNSAMLTSAYSWMLKKSKRQITHSIR
jgi:hypothetical protein